MRTPSQHSKREREREHENQDRHSLSPKVGKGLFRLFDLPTRSQKIAQHTPTSNEYGYTSDSHK